MRGAPLRFETAAEQQWVAGWLGCSPRLARSVVGSLVSKGKFRLQGGALINNRAMQELGLAEQLSEARAAAGQAGGLASGESRRGHDGEHVQPVSATNSGVENVANSSGESHELATRNNDINALAEANAKHVPEARGQRPESTGAPEFSVMQAKLAARLPRGCMWPLRNALDLKPIYTCLEAGADFERHVLPAVEAEAKCAFDGGSSGTWPQSRGPGTRAPHDLEALRRRARNLAARNGPKARRGRLHHLGGPTRRVQHPLSTGGLKM